MSGLVVDIVVVTTLLMQQIHYGINAIYYPLEFAI